MPHTLLSALPADISQPTLLQLLEEIQNRETVLQAMLRRFEKRYAGSLETLEARLARGEGSEHPDWEESIEWRNAAETARRTRILRRLIEWLLGSNAPLPAS